MDCIHPPFLFLALASEKLTGVPLKEMGKQGVILSSVEVCGRSVLEGFSYKICLENYDRGSQTHVHTGWEEHNRGRWWGRWSREEECWEMGHWWGVDKQRQATQRNWKERQSKGDVNTSTNRMPANIQILRGKHPKSITETHGGRQKTKM